MYKNQNLEKLYELIGQLPNTTLQRSDQIDFVHTTNSIWPNKIFNLRCEEGREHDLLTHLEHGVSRKDYPPVITVEPDVENTTLLHSIKQRGYNSTSWIAMTHHCYVMPEFKPSHGFDITVVNSETDLEQWLYVVENGLMNGQKLNYSIFLHLMENQKCALLLGKLDNHPVSASMVMCHDGEAGLYLVSTLPDFRKQGYGRRIAKAAMDMSVKAGCNRIHLQSTSAGKNMYRELGFVERGIIHVFQIQPSF